MDLLQCQPHIHRTDPLVDAAVVMADCDALGKDVCASMLRAIHKDTKKSTCFALDLERAEEFVRQGRDIYMVVANGGHCDQDIQNCPAFFSSMTIALRSGRSVLGTSWGCPSRPSRSIRNGSRFTAT